MMAKKCDICGALYEIEYKPDVRNFNIYSPYRDSWLDLCPKCQEKLERFVCVSIPCRSNVDDAAVLERATPGSFTREIWYDGEWCRNLRADMIDGGHNVHD